MSIMGLVLAVIIGILFSTLCLWAGMKITKVQGTFIAMLIIAAISTLAGFVPLIGWILGTVVMFILIVKMTDAEFWPDAVLMGLVARLLSVVASNLILGAMIRA